VSVVVTACSTKGTNTAAYEDGDSPFPSSGAAYLISALSLRNSVSASVAHGSYFATGQSGSAPADVGDDAAPAVVPSMSEGFMVSCYLGRNETVL